MYSKIKSFMCNCRKKYVAIIIALFIVFFILHIFLSIFNTTINDLIFNYPEEQYQELEKQAESIVQFLEDSNFRGSVTQTLEADGNPEHYVNVEIKNLGEDIQSVSIERAYYSKAESVFFNIILLNILIPILESVVLATVILVLSLIIQFIAWIIHEMITRKANN